MDDKKDERAKALDLGVVFPDVKGLLSFQPLSLKEVCSECLIVLDTNVLLVPYGTGKASLEQIQRTYAELVRQNRLVIPGQVIREFAINRSEKLKALHQQISKKSNAWTAAPDYPLLESVPEYQAIRQIEREVDEKINQYRKAVGRLSSVIRSWYWDDPVTAVYRETLGEQVIHDLVGRTPEFEQELAKRFRHRIPPGNKDASKLDGGAGDVQIWLTILSVAKSRQLHTVFVSADEKSDWWHQSDSSPLYPRFELVDEYRRATGGKTFRIISFANLLDLFGASGEIVGEVERAEAVIEMQGAFALRSRNAVLGVQARRAVQDWVSAACEEEVGAAPPGFDFSVTSEGATFAFVVRFVPRPSLLRQVMEEVTSLEVPDTVQMAYYVFVCAEPKTAPFLDALAPWRDVVGRGYILGRVNETGDFVREYAFSYGRPLSKLSDDD